MWRVSQTSTLDIQPFLFAKDDLHVLSVSGSRQHRQVDYWITQEDVVWDWSEKIWTRRLLECIEQRSLGLKVIPAFMWTTHDYQAQIGTIFPHVRCICAAPFHGMTDILLVGGKIGVTNVVAE